MLQHLRPSLTKTAENSTGWIKIVEKSDDCALEGYEGLE